MAETILGKVCPTPKGVYNATAKYEKLDIIQHDGNGYMVLKECTGVLPSEGEYYMLLSARGSDGAKGADGTDGAAGADGKSAYQAAVEAGYTGTETEFAALMNSIDDKQDKIIGTIGQVVGFDSMGLPHAAHWWSNKNLLINSDFRKPVNQNGKTEYRTQGASIDRWSIDKSDGDCVLYVMDGFIRGENIASGSTNGPVQSLNTTIVNIAELAGKTVTFSMLRRGTGISQIVFTANSNVIGTKGNLVPSDNWVLDSFTMDIPANAATGAVFIYFDTNPATTGYTDFKAAKLEFGSIQTLAHQDTDGNWVLNDPPDYSAQHVLCNMYSPITGEWTGKQRSNPNLLDNWYFIDPINQLGLTEYTANSYTIDRWAATAQDGCIEKVTVGDGYIEIYNQTSPGSTDNNAWFIQRIDDDLMNQLVGKTITLSLLYKGTGDLAIIFNNFRGSHSKHVELVLDNQIHLASYTWTAICGTGDAYLRELMTIGTSNATVQLYAAKAELGSIQTLAHQDANGNWVLNDPPPNKTLERLKCQRYFLRLPGEEAPYTLIGHGKASSNSQLDLQLNTPVPMRVTPTVRMTGNWVAVGAGGYEAFSAENMDISMSSSGATETCIIISGFSNLNPRHVYTIQRNNDPHGNIEFDANL